MGERTGIEWADATWNPIVGCTRVSEGCDHCYAISQAHRGLAPQHRGVTTRSEGGTDWNGTINVAEHRLPVPLANQTPTRYFVNSLSDLFHPEAIKLRSDDGVPQIVRIFAVMAAARRHTFMVLTKRPQVAAYLMSTPMFRLDVNAELLRLGYPVMAGGMTDPDFVWPSNIWTGTTIELDKYSWRADVLRRTPAAVRFISAEPLLGPLPTLDTTGIDWLIVGGESGPGARPMHPDWVRHLRDHHGPGTGTTRPAFFFKQWGDWLPLEPDAQPPFWNGQHPDWQLVDGHQFPPELTEPGAHDGWMTDESPDGDPVVWRRLGKHHSGRELDGHTWSEIPTTRSSR